MTWGERAFDEEELGQIRNMFEQVLRERLGPGLDAILKARGYTKPKSAAALRQERYRQRRIRADGSHLEEKWLARVQYFGWRCRYCGVQLTVGTLTKDHAIPVSRGGSNWPSNLVPACMPCNSSKCDKTPSEFAAYRALG